MCYFIDNLLLHSPIPECDKGKCKLGHLVDSEFCLPIVLEFRLIEWRVALILQRCHAMLSYLMSLVRVQQQEIERGRENTTCTSAFFRQNLHRFCRYTPSYQTLAETFQGQLLVK